MSKSMVNFTKGILTGVVIGTTASMCIRGMSSKSSHPFAHLKAKKGAGKVVKNIGTVMSHFSDMMR